jgi:Ca-activated chloride channel family protein
VIHFAWPWIFALLPLPWLARRLLPEAEPEPQAALRVPFYARIHRLAAEIGQTRPRANASLWLPWLIWLLLLTAAARPQWLGPAVSVPLSGRDLMLAVDLSGSMQIPDMELHGSRADRLDTVKDVAGRFIDRRMGDRLGLILFGTRAYLQTPLTFDRATVHSMLDAAVVGLAGKETAIGDAIGLAVKRLRDHPRESRVLVLLTDGANTAGEVPPLQAAKLAASSGIRIYTIGVGATRMEVEGFFGTRLVNPSADLDEATLRGIAERTGGRYFRARNTGELQDIYRSLDRLEPTVTDSAVFHPRAALYYWPLAAALLLSALLAWLRVAARMRPAPASLTPSPLPQAGEGECGAFGAFSR